MAKPPPFGGMRRSRTGLFVYCDLNLGRAENGIKVFAVPVPGIVKTDFPNEIVNDGWLETEFERPCFNEILPTATAHAKWGAKIYSFFVRAIGVVFSYKT
jgi:hypothetical protein